MLGSFFLFPAGVGGGKSRCPWPRWCQSTVFQTFLHMMSTASRAGLVGRVRKKKAKRRSAASNA